MTTNRYFVCKCCETGKVHLIRKETSSNVTLNVKNCDNKKCNASYGLKSLIDLTELKGAAATT